MGEGQQGSPDSGWTHPPDSLLAPDPAEPTEQDMSAVTQKRKRNPEAEAPPKDSPVEEAEPEPKRRATETEETPVASVPEDNDLSGETSLDMDVQSAVEEAEASVGPELGTEVAAESSEKPLDPAANLPSSNGVDHQAPSASPDDLSHPAPEPPPKRPSRRRGSLEPVLKPMVDAAAPDRIAAKIRVPAAAMPRGEDKDIAAQLAAANSDKSRTERPPRPAQSPGWLSHIAVALILLGVAMISRLRILPDTLIGDRGATDKTLSSPAPGVDDRTAELLRSRDTLSLETERAISDLSSSLDELRSLEEESADTLRQSLRGVSEDLDRIGESLPSTDRLSSSVRGMEESLSNIEIPQNKGVRDLADEGYEKLSEVKERSGRAAELAAEVRVLESASADLHHDSVEVSASLDDMPELISPHELREIESTQREAGAALSDAEAELLGAMQSLKSTDGSSGSPTVDDSLPVSREDSIAPHQEAKPSAEDDAQLNIDSADSAAGHASNPLKRLSGSLSTHLEKSSGALEDTLQALEDAEAVSLVLDEVTDESLEVSTEDLLKERMVGRLEGLREELESNLSSIAVDYAVSVRGGRVIARDGSISGRNRLTSPSYVSSLNPIQLVKHIVGPLKMQTDPSVVISHSMPVFGPNRAFLRQCYCFKGSEGSITIGFQQPVALETLQVFHLALAEATSVYKGSSPRHFSARGYLQGGGIVELGAFMYSSHPGFEELQSFPVSLAQDALVKAVSFFFTSNGGAPFTCIYRLRAIGRVIPSDEKSI